MPAWNFRAVDAFIHSAFFLSIIQLIFRNTKKKKNVYSCFEFIFYLSLELFHPLYLCEDTNGFTRGNECVSLGVHGSIVLRSSSTHKT